jgi:YegS/Rv2252/BmrU family lipid kinase
MREATVICRLSSRHGVLFYRRLAEALPERGITIAEAHMVRRRRELKKRVRQAVKARRSLVIVIGGDGTQTAAVCELANSHTVLGVVPAGTGNSFALSLGIDADVEAAIETIVSGKVLSVDLGIVNGTYFANFASVGLIAEAANQTPKGIKRIFGPLAYGLAALRPLFARKPFAMNVRWSEGDLDIVTHQAIVSSGRYYGWQPLTPQANVRSGDLAFFVAAGRTPLDAVAVNAALLSGRQTELSGAHYFSAPKITVRTKPKQPVNIDGHAFGKTPAHFRIARRALRVLVPANFENGS